MRQRRALTALLLAVAARASADVLDDLKRQAGSGGQTPPPAAVVALPGASGGAQWPSDRQAACAQLQGVFDKALGWYRAHGYGQATVMKCLPDQPWGDPVAHSPAGSHPAGGAMAAKGSAQDVATVLVGAEIFPATRGRADPKAPQRVYSPQDQAFFVLAHELAHLALGHYEALDEANTKAMRRFFAMGGPGEELERLASLGDRATPQQRRRVAELRGQEAALDSHSAQLELPMEQAADARAVDAAAGAGADPAAGVGFMYNMIDVFAQEGMRVDASTHGSPQERAAQIRGLAAGR